MHKVDFETGVLLLSGVSTTLCWILKLQIDGVFILTSAMTITQRCEIIKHPSKKQRSTYVTRIKHHCIICVSVMDLAESAIIEDFVFCPSRFN